MRPSELHVFLKAALAAKLPVLITGAPGIGKSEIVANAVHEAGAALILSHPAVADPTDPAPTPVEANVVANELPGVVMSPVRIGKFAAGNKPEIVAPVTDAHVVTPAALMAVTN